MDNIDPNGEVFKVVEQKPLFPGEGCGEMKTYEEQKACSDEAMLAYIYQRIAYPQEAKAQEREGTAVVSFIVEADGSMPDVRLVRDPGSEMGEVALAAVKQMKTDGITWVPGIQKGKKVRVRFNLPVRFKLA